jgi:diketogulonate reductase-like aldo/keto reductase
MTVEGYSPLSGTNLHHPTLTAVAATHGANPGQVVLRWHVQHGIVVIPKSGHPDRLRTNLDLWTFELNPAEMASIDLLHA